MLRKLILLLLIFSLSSSAFAQEKYLVKTKDGREVYLSKEGYKKLKRKLEAKKREAFMDSRREKLKAKKENSKGPLVQEQLADDIEFLSEKEPEQISIKLSEEVPQEEKLSELELKRRELQENEQKTLDFIYPSVDQEAEEILASEDYFTNSEREQLLELWRATIARNRTIQFLIKVLSPDPDMFKKNNAVMQGLSKAIFVPFYAVNAVSSNALINSGSAVGARVLGDAVDGFNAHQSRTRSITHTELVVMFMMVDEVAERLRSSYKDYKLTKVRINLLNHELKEAQFEASEALNLEGPGSESAKFFTRMVLRNIQRNIRDLAIQLRSKRHNLRELAGPEAVSSVDVLIDLEVESQLDKAVSY